MSDRVDHNFNIGYICILTEHKRYGGKLTVSDADIKPTAPMISLTSTVAITNAIFTFSQLPAGTCCFLGNRTRRCDLLCHRRRLNARSARQKQ